MGPKGWWVHSKPGTDRSDAGTAAAVRDAEGLVQVEMAHVSPEVSGPAQPHLASSTLRGREVERSRGREVERSRGREVER